MIFGATRVALSMLPLSQRASLSICDTRDFDIAARSISLRSGVGIELELGAIDFWFTFAQNKFQGDFGAICEPELNHVDYGTAVISGKCEPKCELDRFAMARWWIRK